MKPEAIELSVLIRSPFGDAILLEDKGRREDTKQREMIETMFVLARGEQLFVQQIISRDTGECLVSSLLISRENKGSNHKAGLDRTPQPFFQRVRYQDLYSESRRRGQIIKTNWNIDFVA